METAIMNTMRWAIVRFFIRIFTSREIKTAPSHAEGGGTQQRKGHGCPEKTFQRTFRMAARRDAMQQKSPRTSRVGGLRNQMHGRIGAVHAGARRVWQPRCHRILVRPEVLRPCFSVRYALKAAILLRFRPSEFAGMRDSHPIGQKIRRKCGNTCSNDRGNYRNNGSSVVSGRRRNVPLNAFDCRGYRRL